MGASSSTARSCRKTASGSPEPQHPNAGRRGASPYPRSVWLDERTRRQAGARKRRGHDGRDIDRGLETVPSLARACSRPRTGLTRMTTAFASLLIHEGRSPAEVAVQLGDAVATVASTYTHAFVEAEALPRELRRTRSTRLACRLVYVSCTSGLKRRLVAWPAIPHQERKPTPGLEPGTPSLREKSGVVAGGWGRASEGRVRKARPLSCLRCYSQEDRSDAEEADVSGASPTPSPALDLKARVDQTRAE